MIENLTKHALERASQRGLKPPDIQILFELGKLGFKQKEYHSGAIYWFFGNKVIKNAIRFNKLKKGNADRYIGTTLVLDLNELHVITVVKEKRGPDQLRKNLINKRKSKKYGGNVWQKTLLIILKNTL